MCVAIGLFACGNGPPAGSTGTGGGGGGACAGSASGTAPGAVATTINATDDLLFVPASSPPIAAGDVIEFKNTGSVPHTVTFDAANAACLTDDTLNPGGTWYVKIMTAGAYKYICTIHAPNMNGVLNISGSAGGASGATPTPAPGSTPSTAATPTPST